VPAVRVICSYATPPELQLGPGGRKPKIKGGDAGECGPSGAEDPHQLKYRRRRPHTFRELPERLSTFNRSACPHSAGTESGITPPEYRPSQAGYPAEGFHSDHTLCAQIAGNSSKAGRSHKTSLPRPLRPHQHPALGASISWRWDHFVACQAVDAEPRGVAHHPFGMCADSALLLRQRPPDTGYPALLSTTARRYEA
jgi:hypothetical protein